MLFRAMSLFMSLTAVLIAFISFFAYRTLLKQHNDKIESEKECLDLQYHHISNLLTSKHVRELQKLYGCVQK